MQEESALKSIGLSYGNQAGTQCDGSLSSLSHQVPPCTGTWNAFGHRLGLPHTSLRALPFPRHVVTYLNLAIHI